MKTNASTLAVFLALGALTLCAVDVSPIVSHDIEADNSPAVVAAAAARGAATATRDIKAGTFRILYYGLPWGGGDPLVDDATGYRVQPVAGCDVGETFAAEVKAYNMVMREWYKKNKAAK